MILIAITKYEKGRKEAGAICSVSVVIFELENYFFAVTKCIKERIESSLLYHFLHESGTVKVNQ